MAKRAALLLLTKEFDSGEVQSRFCPPLTDEHADLIAKAFLSDASELASMTAYDTDVWCGMDGEDQVVRTIMPPTVRILPSRGIAECEKRAFAIDDLSTMGYRRVVLVNADCPTIDNMYVNVALDALNNNDAVIGPSLDGGYALIGVSKPIPRLFLDMDTTTNDLLRQTLFRANDLDLKVGMLPPRNLINSMQDLERAFESGELAQAAGTLAACQTVGV